MTAFPTWPRGRKPHPGPRTRKQLRKLRLARQAQNPSTNKEDKQQRKTEAWVRRRW